MDVAGPRTSSAIALPVSTQGLVDACPVASHICTDGIVVGSHISCKLAVDILACKNDGKCIKNPSAQILVYVALIVETPK